MSKLLNFTATRGKRRKKRSCAWKGEGGGILKKEEKEEHSPASIIGDEDLRVSSNNRAWGPKSISI
jgi:hypothetical protein